MNALFVNLNSRTKEAYKNLKYFSPTYWLKSTVFIFLIICLTSCICINKFSHGRLVNPKPSEYTLPFESIDGFIILQVKVNGIEGKFMLDNGFSLCALDEEFATLTQVKFSGVGSVNDANNNNIELQEAKIDEISIGPFTLHNSYGNQLNTDRFLPCDAIDGVLGASFINQMNWKIDFEHKLITLRKKEFDIEGIHIPFRVGRNNISSILLDIDGKPFNTMIDFGYQGLLQVHSDYLTHFNGFDAELRGGIQSLSVSGLGSIDTSYTLSNVPLTANGKSLIPSSEMVIKSNLSEDAVIGIHYFENYTVFINNTSKEFILLERSDFKFPIKLNYNVSLYVIDNTIKIVQLNLNDPLSEELKLMQSVSEIDHRPSSEFLNICYLKSYMKTKRGNNQAVTIQLEGSSKEYKIQAKNTAKQVINSIN